MTLAFDRELTKEETVQLVWDVFGDDAADEVQTLLRTGSWADISRMRAVVAERMMT